MLRLSGDITDTYVLENFIFFFTTNHKRHKENLNTEYSLKKGFIVIFPNSLQPFHPACKAETDIREEKDGSQKERNQTANGLKRNQ